MLRGRAAGSRFLASMHYRIIPTDPEKYDMAQGRWRVTASAYLYEFRARSDGHFVTPRQTLESAVQ